MTIGQQLIQQGKLEGIQQGKLEGIQQGKLEGRLEGERTMLLRLLKQRFGGAVDQQTERRIAGASSDQIERWGERILTAATLAEVLGD